MTIHTAWPQRAGGACYFAAVNQPENTVNSTTMKTPIFLLSALLLLVSCKKDGLTGSGAIVTETRNVPDFYIVRVDGDAAVEIVEGSPRTVEVSGYENLVPRFETSSANGQLILRFENEVKTVRRNNIKVRITAPYVDEAVINGSGRFDLTDMTSNDMTLSVKGSGAIKASNCVWGSVVAAVDGSGSIDAPHTVAGFDGA
ncbi:MAG: hypothetical protein EOO11_22430, partial [Chitinophagaceae bacterium]